MITYLSLIFPSGIHHFPLVALSGLTLNYLTTIQISKFIPITNQCIKSPNLVSGTYHSTSSGVLSAKHSTTNEFFIVIGSK
jgi:hypothetical protein